MISLTEARAMISEAVLPLDPVRATLADAHRRVLREEIRAPEDLPAFDRSAMDGYALRRDDPAERFAVVAEIQPGAPLVFELKAGQCARIFTGAAIPAGATQVLMQEDARREGEWMIPLQRGEAAHIRRRGEDARAGDVLLKAGARLGAGEVSLAAHIGVTQVRVSPAPRVLHITTGNEIVRPHQQPAPGQIRDSNSTLIAALLADSGAALIAQRHCSDRLDALVDGVRVEREDAWDVLLISGGASVGDYDFGVRALEALGFAIQFQKINLRPGKPLVFGTRARQAVFVIPGNPVSHFVTFYVAIRLALDCLEALPPAWNVAPAALAEPLTTGGDGRETWWPARLTFRDQVRAQPLSWRSSGDVRGLAGANALLRIVSAGSEIPAGAMLDCLWLEHRG